MPDLVPPIVVGHEFVGDVIDYGPDTDRRVAPGSIVTAVPYLDTPNGPQLIGLSPAITGGLAERMVLQESRLLPVNDGVKAAHAPLAEPLAVGLHAVAAAFGAQGRRIEKATEVSEAAREHPDEPV
jgi:threonine dehydrogenase-like Zn-dependent dehydrogenase